jgi:tetratricopeptide (TPR) repeat protein
VHASVAEVVKLLADYANQRGQAARAIALNQRLLAMQEKLSGLQHLSVADTLMRLVDLWIARQDHEPAQTACERAVGIRRRSLAADDPSMVQAELTLATLYEEQGETGKAAIIRQRVGEISRPLLAKGVDADLARKTGMNRADLHVLDGVDRLAKPNTEHRNFELLAASFANRGQIYAALGDYSEAESLLHQALIIYDKILGEGYDEVSVVLENYASILSHLGRADEAEQLQARATALQARRQGKAGKP